MFVYVINQHGQPLMPCTPRKARLLLKAGKAKVVHAVPFTLQLLYGSSGYRQDVGLGVDAGTRHIGISATTENEVLFEAEVHPRTDIQALLATRKQYRRVRRSRKTRYRPARYANRKKPNGWLAPSVQHKVESHLKAIRFVGAILPVNRITIEVAQFDMQKIKNPSIAGEEYQHGPQYDFWNTRQYVLWRDEHRCQRCQGKAKDPILNVHHIESSKTGGDSPDNLVTLCETCHTALHKNHLESTLTRRSSSLRDATQVNMMRWQVYEQAKALCSQVCLTYGYQTKQTRIATNLEKSHCIDARCISGHPQACSDGTSYLFKCVRRNNRQLHKATIRKGGMRSRNTAPRYVKGFRLFDQVRYEGKLCFIFGRRSSGYFDLRRLDGAKVHASANSKHLHLVQRSSTCLRERRSGIPPTPEGASILPLES
jgi:5-methylcytosine-specific restriction endonuclease McrA